MEEESKASDPDTPQAGEPPTESPGDAADEVASAAPADESAESEPAEAAAEEPTDADQPTEEIVDQPSADTAEWPTPTPAPAAEADESAAVGTDRRVIAGVAAVIAAVAIGGIGYAIGESSTGGVPSFDGSPAAATGDWGSPPAQSSFAADVTGHGPANGDCPDR